MQTLLRSTRFAWTFWGHGNSAAKLRRFSFLDVPPARDGELELVAPSAQWVDAVMASARHPMTLEQSPGLSGVSRRQLGNFLAASPDGHQPADPPWRSIPAYHFWMVDHQRHDLPIAGAICLRIGTDQETDFYYGHVGYHVYPPHRGRHFAERAVRLLFPLARRHGVNPIWITCNPDNWASRRTCQRLGATLVQTVAVPSNHPLYAVGEVAKCRYRVDDRGDVHSRWPS